MEMVQAPVLMLLCGHHLLEVGTLSSWFVSLLLGTQFVVTSALQLVQPGTHCIEVGAIENDQPGAGQF
jgi:hypothetical protein